MSRRTREARMAAQAERVPVLERHVTMPAKVETIACTVHVGADVHVEAPSPPQDEPAAPPAPMPTRELAVAVAAIVERALGRGSRRSFRVVQTRRGLDVRFAAEPHPTQVTAARRALIEELPGVATVEGRAALGGAGSSTA